MQIQNALLTGSTTVYGPITFVSGTLVGSSSYAATSSYADTFTVAGSLTAQTLVVQTITSSVSFITGSTRFGSLLTNTHTFTGSIFLTGSAINVNNSKAIIGDDISYGAAYQTLAFGSATNGFNRISGHSGTLDGLYFMAATGRGFVFRPNGSTIGNFIIASTGRVGIGTNLAGPSALLHISGSGSDPLMQISSTVSSSIFYVSGSGNIGIGTTSPTARLEVNVGLNSLKISGRDTYVDSTEDATNANIYVTQAGVGDFSQLAGNLVLQARTQGTVYRDIIFAGGLSNGDALMTILGEGNVGIGTTDVVSTNLTGSLTIRKSYNGDTPNGATTQAYYSNQSALYLFGRNSGLSIISNNNEEGKIAFGNNSAAIYASITTGTAATSVGGDMYFKVGSDTERMRITTVGRVGIGTTSPDTRLHLYDGTNPLSLKIQRTTVPVFFSDVQTAGTTAGAVWSHNIENTSNGSFTWSGLTNTSYAGSAIILNSDTSTSYTTFHTANSANTAPTERMRITGAGVVLIGKTATAAFGTAGWQLDAAGSGLAVFAINNNEAFIFNNINTGTTYQIDFRTNAVERGAINVTDSGTTYTTTSDYRVKEDFKDFNGLEKLNNIKVYDFKFKDLEERMDGVIAHELQEVIPYAVHGEKDGVKFQSVDYSRIVPVLVKSIQELSTKLEEATTRIKTLESK